MNETLKTEVKEETKEAQAEAPIESQNIVAPEMTKKEQLLSVGEQRYEKVSQAIGGARGKFSSWVKGGAVKFGRFLKGAAFGVLASPEAIAHGAKVGYEKAGEEVGYVRDTAVQGVKLAGESFESVGEDVVQASKWVEGKAVSAYDVTAEKLKQADEWLTKKEEKLNKLGADGIDLASAVAGVLADRTAEKFNKAKDGLEKQYNGVKEFGGKSIDAVVVLSRRAKDEFNNKWNAFMEDVLKKRAENQEAKLKKTLAKLEQYKKVEQLRFSLS